MTNLLKQAMRDVNCIILILFLVLPGFGQQNRAADDFVEGSPVKSEIGKLYSGSYALIIGVSDYTNGWNSLPGVKHDVPAVKIALEKQGFNVKVLMNLKSDELSTAIDSFINEHGLSDYGNRLLFYFAGHGATLKAIDGREDLGYIVPIDAPLPSADAAGFRRKAVSMDTIQFFASKIQSKHALFLFDSCFSGKLISRSNIAAPRFNVEDVGRPTRQFITSGAANQTVPDESDFRKLFVRSLAGEADVDRDGFVLGSELASFLKGEFATNKKEQTPQYGKIMDFNLNQGDFVFIVGQQGSAFLARLPAARPNEPPTAKRSAKMDVAEAQRILDRAVREKTGSQQGQNDAIEALLANGHEFNSADLSGVSFRGANFSKGKFQQAKLHAVDFSTTNAQEVDFSDTGLRFASLESTILKKAILKGTYAPFVSGKDANFEGAGLAKANFFAADFRGADFTGAKLHGTSLAFADLRGSKFDGADLTGAYLTGALLDGNTTFLNATIVNTEFAGAVSEKFALNQKQLSGACRHPKNDNVQWDVRLLVTRMKTVIAEDGRQMLVPVEEGASHDYIMEGIWNHFGEFGDLSLPLCTSDTKAADKFDSFWPGVVFNVHLDFSYASKAGRREKFPKRVEEHRDMLLSNYSKDKILKGDAAQVKNWDSFLRTAAGNIKPVSKPYVNSDLLLVLLSSQNLIDLNRLRWTSFASAHYKLETKIRNELGGKFGEFLMWSPLFPPAPWQDLPEDRVEIYKKWTTARAAGTTPKDLVIKRMLNRQGEENNGNLKIGMEVQEIMDYAGGERGSRSIPNGFESAVKAKNIDMDRITFAPGSWELGDVAFVWSERLSSYSITVPKDIAAEKDLYLEIDARLNRIEPFHQEFGVVEYCCKGALLFVSPGEARLVKDGKVFWRGQVQIAETAKLRVDWLEGRWEGLINESPQSNYKILLTSQSNKYLVEYPSLSCRGELAFVEATAGYAIFEEKITSGPCSDFNGQVRISGHRKSTSIGYERHSRRPASTMLVKSPFPGKG